MARTNQFFNGMRWAGLGGLLLLSACGGSGGGSTPLPTPDFTLSATPPAGIQAGSSGPVTVAVARTGGHSAAVALSLSAPPAGITGSGTISAGGASGTLTLNVAAATAPATQTLTVSGTDGTSTRTATFALTVTPLPGVTSFGGTYAWACSSGQNCQSVFDFTVAAGSVLNVSVSAVSSGSVAQLALYAPGVALGGTNLLTGNTKELRCASAGSCDAAAYAAGEHKNGVVAAVGGTYRLAVTRVWGISCGGSGTFRVDVTSNIPFQAAGPTVQNQQSAVAQAESECK